ncbi:MAG TPA: HEAT repeat domain-containing protein [Candidatus Bathyarchaeia archaeon]|nr:HEAT repeat domain-containing protein [Candidatus Bathyarchaeia archaeon]
MRKKINNNKRITLSLILLLLIFPLIISIYSFLVIYESVKANCLKAQKEYQVDCVDALIKLVQSESKTVREKNLAIWSLGQLADEKALPLLYELNQSLPEQERCVYGSYLCKYEIQKAIKWCETGNVTNWMYKNRSNWHY